ncbi:hypothetical protein HPB48_013829 [Haemaphysalis longicornis]|uniref:DUF659 domain-containing protein n=1 Tax=Haemaphysalis longicornis TaxID=44386 RepID=A0A9J6GH13_HAELO|nr:hypothetical protein HPB48_013829 [Haemaphysalis longicornis]
MPPRFCCSTQTLQPTRTRAAHLLKAFYPQMLPVTCLAHALNRVCEELRMHFTDVNELIGSAKAVFLKAPSRVRVFKGDAS